MVRKLLALLSLLLAFTVLAKDRAVAPAKLDEAQLAKSSGASVTGEVASVSGNLITLTGGLVTIDATNAKILQIGDAATVADLQPGALITALLQEPTAVSTAPLVATTIAVLRNADLTFTGTIQNVDVAGSQFLLLNRTIKVDANTTFVNFRDNASIAGVQPDMRVLVEANVVGSTLVASRLTLIASLPPRPQAARGVVKSVGTDAWVITVGDRDTTFVVNASTKILGSPKAGDKVDVLYTVDNAHANVALSIIKSLEAPKVVTFNGVVKSIATPLWVITRDDDQKDVTVDWPLSVRMSPVAKVGDRVTVIGTANSDGTYTAVVILPRR